MNTTIRSLMCLIGAAICCTPPPAHAQDWPQWRGANRDAKTANFKTPATWPKELTQKWKVTVGNGVATPALVGDKLYVFTRQDASETTLCLTAADGKEVWKDQYEARAVTGPASGFGGPRSSPSVAEGKVVTLGVAGTLSCLDAAKGTVLWRKVEFPGALPNFFASSSPIIAGGLCVAQLGGSANGGIVAFDLASGNEKWRWTGDGPGYASPALINLPGANLIVAETASKLVALSLTDGKQVWETPFRTRYNASSPVVDGQMIIYAGPGSGATAVRFEKEGDGMAGKQLWSNPDGSVMYNTPVIKDGFLYGLSDRNVFWCLNVQDGKTAWTAPVIPPAPAAAAAPAGGETQPAGGAGGRRGGRGGGGGGGYGSIVDAGSVLLALTPSMELIAFQPSEKAYTELARIKVADSQTHAYPVVSGNRVFVKDQNSFALLTLE